MIFLLLFALAPGSGAFAQQFSLPRPPAELRSVPERAGWLIEHFWDKADLRALASPGSAPAAGDPSHQSPDSAPAPTVEAPDPAPASQVLEQAFVNYISLFPLAEDDSRCRSSVGALLHRADTVSVQFLEDVFSLAEKYLFKLESPSANEEYFLFFLDAGRSCRGLSPLRRRQCVYWHDVVMNNRVGTQVNDFTFATAKGRTMHLSEVGGERLLLIFDLSCEDCREMIRGLEASCPAGTTVVAVAVNADKAAFRKFAGTMPKTWVCGYDSTGTVNGQAFALRKLPELYRISADGIVSGKHLTLAQIVNN